MAVRLTQSAAKQVKRQLDARGKGVGLRLGVKKSGCSGFSYTIDFADSVGPVDQVFEGHGVKVIVNTEYIKFLDGLELDYRKDGINEAFHFNNPNVKESCGCGESFSV